VLLRCAVSAIVGAGNVLLLLLAAAAAAAAATCVGYGFAWTWTIDHSGHDLLPMEKLGTRRTLAGT